MHIVSLQQRQKEAVQGHKLSLNLLKCSAIYRKSCRYILEKIIIIKPIVLKKQKSKKRERETQTLRYTILTVTVARSPSGTLATMMPMRKMTASSHVYPRMSDRMKKLTPKKTATPVMMWMKCSISMLIGVRRTSSSDARVAMRPITVRSPVAITMPRAVPAVGGH